MLENLKAAAFLTAAAVILGVVLWNLAPLIYIIGEALKIIVGSACVIGFIAACWPKK